MARGKSSIVHQCKAAINAIDRIGQSKRDARAKGESGIHSLKQKKETLSGAQNYVKWVRSEYGVKDIHQLKEQHYRAYLNHLKEKGRSVGHRQNVETAIRHLQKGMALRSEKYDRPSVHFCPSKRVVQEDRSTPRDRSYTQQEYQQIQNSVSNNVKHAVMLSRELGLRVREACYVRVEHFYKERGEWSMKIENGTGITKAGRFREVPVPERFNKELERMLERSEPHERLVFIHPDTVRRAVNEACRKTGIKQNGRGMHGFRHAYARERVDQLMQQKGIAASGKQMLERIMENRDQGRAADYGVFDHNHQLYQEVTAVVNQVHSEIGHGSNRWDLAAIYMR